ncbi:efflux RND transporter periplasmic adaptor subunit [Alloacidobacterium dinghuense]|uniref:Efflux RND transporter periplasmic adaptor subunit n=1 Tax=Alloacidobacterium dinghuense TaxID=2763107 RepID=A0A7G8BLZ7_9BACT|nr:efflux RND transporter periplasmic adaptor subunit [Alloacidobacterium dinghuense]
MDQRLTESIPPDHQLPSASSGDSARRSSKRRQWLWILLLLAFAVVLFVILRRHDDPAKTAAAPGGGRRGFGGPVTLTVATAQKGDIGVYRDAIGTVTPVYTASIYNQVTGVITQVHYREGQTVQKGDPLVDIDPRQYEAQVESAQGALERDTNLLAQAKMDLNRYQQAWDRKAIAKQQLDDQEKIVAQNEGLVRADQGTLDFDKVQLSYCHITAPFTGRVGLRLIDPGNLVQSSGSTVLAVLTQVQPITVVFTLAQDYLPDVFAQKGRGVGLSVDAYDREQTKKLASGKLLALDNQIDTTTGTVKLRATFDNRDGALFPNQFVNTRLLVTTEHGMTLIPSSAIQHNGQVSFVYVIADGTAHLKNVKAGVSDHGITAVEGINPGDQLATSSFEKLQSGSKVTISKQPLSQSNSETEAP